MPNVLFRFQFREPTFSIPVKACRHIVQKFLFATVYQTNGRSSSFVASLYNPRRNRIIYGMTSY